MGKCVDKGYIPYVKINVCSDCIHKDVCGDKDYLTENRCSEKIRGDAKHITELLNVEEQGLLVRLPCKVGSEVYFINPPDDCEICPALVTRIGINLFTPEHPLWIRIEYTSKLLGIHDIQGTLDSMLGVRLFLTREEAKAALKEANRNG